MLIKKYKFIRDEEGNFHDPTSLTSSSNPDRKLCIDGLMEIFEIPEGTAEIGIQVHSHPARDRIKIQGHKDGYSYTERLVDGVFVTFYSDMRKTIDILLKGRKAIYVEVWYE